MRKHIVLPLLVLLAACGDRGPIGPDGDGPQFAKCPGPGCDKGGGGGDGGGGGGEPLPTDVHAIVFARSGLVVMNADGSNGSVVFDASGVMTPSWSGDGNSIVFHQRTDQWDAIFRLNGARDADGNFSPIGDPTHLAPCAAYFGTPRANCHPAWSPHGTWVAVAEGYTRGASSIVLVDPLGVADPDIIYTGPAGPSGDAYSKVRWPAWSPESDRVAFVLEPYGVSVDGCASWYPCVIIIERMEGGSWETIDAIQLFETTVGTFQYVESLEWTRTAGGESLVFSGAGTDRNGGVYNLDITSGAVTRVLTGGRWPVWSSDDGWLAWVKTRNDQLWLSQYPVGEDYKVASNVADPDWRR
jgi:hypothetical protein